MMHTCTLIFIMTVFFFSIKKTQVPFPEPKCTALVFVLSVQYQYSVFLCLKKRQSLWKSEYAWIHRLTYVDICMCIYVRMQVDKLKVASRWQGYICVCTYVLCVCVYVYICIYIYIYIDQVPISRTYTHYTHTLIQAHILSLVPSYCRCP